MTSERMPTDATPPAGEPAAADEVAWPSPASAPRPWLASYPPHVPASWPYPPVAMTRLLDDAAADFPTTTALRSAGVALTYRELLDAVDRFAVALGALGVEPGQRVGLLLPGVPHHVIALLAVWRRGASAVSLPPDAPAAVTGARLEDEGCRVVVCAESCYPTLAALKGELTTVRHVALSETTEDAPLPRRLLWGLRGWRERRRLLAGEGVQRMRDLIAAAPPAPPEGAVGARDEALVVHQGGERLAVSHDSLVAATFQLRLWLPDIHAGSEAVLAAEPLHTVLGVVGGLGLATLTAATLELTAEGAAGALRAAARRGRPTLLVAGPRATRALAQAHERRDLGALRLGLCVAGHTEASESADAAAPESAAVAEEVQQAEAAADALAARSGARVRVGWGCPPAPLISANPLYGRAERGSLGLPLPDTACWLGEQPDPAAPAHPTQDTGPLWVAGPQVAAMRGAWQDGEPDARHWLATGVRAHLDRAGYLHPRDN